MSSQLTGKQQSYCGVYLTRREGGLLAVVRKRRRFHGHTVKHVVDKRVEDAHGSVGYLHIRVEKFQQFVDVPGEAFFGCFPPSSVNTRTTFLDFLSRHGSVFTVKKILVQHQKYSESI